MIRKYALLLVLALAVLLPAAAQHENTRICHSVVFKLKHAPGSPGEKDFLAALIRLAEIPGVENLKLSPEISKKNNFEFYLSMEFADQAAYDHYNNHPDHVAFVQDRWLKEVEDFMEIDYALTD